MKQAVTLLQDNHPEFIPKKILPLRFIGGRSSLPLHELNGDVNGGCVGVGGAYYLGMFLGGAYQEAIGGLHNLFGGPSVVRVSQSNGPHCFAVTRAVPGSSCADVLRAMQHEPELMFETLKHRAEEYPEADAFSCALASAFHSMPYLVYAASSPVGTSDSEGGSGSNMEGSVDCCSEEEDWEFMRGLSV